MLIRGVWNRIGGGRLNKEDGVWRHCIRLTHPASGLQTSDFISSYWYNVFIIIIYHRKQPLIPCLEISFCSFCWVSVMVAPLKYSFQFPQELVVYDWCSVNMRRGNWISHCSCSKTVCVVSQCRNVIKIALKYILWPTHTAAHRSSEILLTASAHSLAVWLQGSSTAALHRWVCCLVCRQRWQIVEIANCGVCFFFLIFHRILSARIWQQKVAIHTLLAECWQTWLFHTM